MLFRSTVFLTAFPWLTTLAIIALAGCALALAGVAATRQWRRLPGTMAGTAVITLMAAQFGALSGMRPEPVEEMAALLRANQTVERSGEYQVFVRNLVFYAGRKQETIFTEQNAVDFLKSPDRVLLVVRERDLERLETLSGVTTVRLGSVRYVDTANIKLRTVLWPLPDQDVETVWLVSNRSREYLAWIEDVMGIEGGLHTLHQGDLIGRWLESDIRLLGEADPVLATD